VGVGRGEPNELVAILDLEAGQHASDVVVDGPWTAPKLAGNGDACETTGDKHGDTPLSKREWQRGADGWFPARPGVVAARIDSISSGTRCVPSD